MIKEYIKTKGIALGHWMRHEIFYKKLISPGGIALLLLLALVCGYMSAKGFFFIPLAIGVLLIGLTVLYMCLFSPLHGYFLLSLHFLFFIQAISLVRIFPQHLHSICFFIFLLLVLCLVKKYGLSPHKIYFLRPSLSYSCLMLLHLYWKLLTRIFPIFPGGQHRCGGCLPWFWFIWWLII